MTCELPVNIVLAPTKPTSDRGVGQENRSVHNGLPHFVTVPLSVRWGRRRALYGGRDLEQQGC